MGWGWLGGAWSLTAQAWRARRDGRGLVVVVLNDGRVGMGFVAAHPVFGQAQGGGVHDGVSILYGRAQLE